MGGVTTVLLGAGILLALLLGCGVVRQATSLTECSPGKPSMSPVAFVIAGFGGTICEEPLKKSQSSKEAPR